MVFSGTYRVSSPFGWRDLGGTRDYHKGIDLVGITDKEIHAHVGGKVGMSTILDPATDKTLTWQWGNFVRIDGDDGLYYYYCHMSQRLVYWGQRVEAGDVIGIEGNTGYSFGSHCHFEVRNASGESMNPAPLLGIPNVEGTYENKTETEDNMKDELKVNDSIPDEWAREAVEWATKNGIMYGDENGDLKLRASCTREQMIVFLYRLYNMLK